MNTFHKNVGYMPYFTLKKEELPSAVATLVGNITKVPLDDLKSVLWTVTHEMEDRKIPLGSLSKQSE